MPPRRLRAEAPTRAERQQQRRQLGRLTDLRLRPRTLERYRQSVRMLARWLENQGLAFADSYEGLDRQLMEFIEHLWDTGESRSVGNYTLAAVQHFLNVRARFVGAWSLISAWQRMELPVRTPPLPVLVLTGLAGWALQHGRLDFTACLLVGFAGFLRTGEILSLTRDLVIFDGQNSAVLVLPQTKMSERRGGPERVPITDVTAVHYLRRRCALLRPGERVFSGSGGHFRDLFRRGLADLRLTNFGFEANLTAYDAEGQHTPTALARTCLTSCSWDAGHMSPRRASMCKKVWCDSTSSP